MLLLRRQIKILVIVLCAILALLTTIAVGIHFNWIKFSSPVKQTVTVEVGTKEISEEMFFENDDDQLTIVTNLSDIDLSNVGSHTISFTKKNRVYTTTLLVIDTTAPVIQTISKEIYTDETVTPSDMISEIIDLSDTTVSFLTEPPFGTAGEHQIQISVIDTSGNETIETATLTIIRDEIAPTFSPMEDINVQVGGTISYKKGVTVSDNHDETVLFSVDSSSVDLSKAGTYEITYTATDKAGNTATAKRTVNVTIKPVIDRDLVDNMAKDVLNKIITDDMTEHEKIDTIFRWVRKNMVYASSPEQKIPEAAYVAFTKKRGDCYNYYAMTTVLLDGCGIQNMKIERYGGKTSHIWLLVNIGSGWYHYDTTPQHHLYPYTCFMKTDQEVWDYAKSRGDGRSDYYNFNLSLYPERATISYGR